MDWTPFALSLRLGLVVTLLLPPLCLPAALLLARKGRPLLALPEAFANLPLVLPPTVLGFYILVALSPAGPVGSWIERVFGARLVFSFSGLVIASLVACAPYMTHGLVAGLRAIPRSEIETSLALGKGPVRAFIRVGLPALAPSAVSGMAMVFAHCVGEFGVVMMIGGAIPGRTETASIAMFRWVESLEYGKAHAYALALLALSFAILASVSFARRAGEVRGGGS
jgi:molybdate transport system permease protein